MGWFETFVTTENILFLIKGAGLSLLLALCSVVLGTLLGTIAAAGKISKHKILNLLSNIYIEIIRGTPMLLQLMLFFFGLPQLIPGYKALSFDMQILIVGIVGMSINSGAYTAELIRSSIQSIDKGQWEAGRSLGLSYKKIMMLIILPQAFKRIIPPLVSEFIVLIKDSSLISSIGAVELLKGAQIIGSKYYNYITPLCMAAVLYLMMTLTVSYFAKKLEKRMQIGD